jgi:hypothetical protein
MTQFESTFVTREVLICDGCGFPIFGEPLTHHSILGVTFVAHDFECCLAAHMKKLRELSIGPCGAFPQGQTPLAK